ncbi:hypothetical protein PQX77_006856 [Marasmius sp. AFHP31]|nr:hypothetical protein PQX77_006856 [Marasmius sp. AFHP31]
MPNGMPHYIKTVSITYGYKFRSQDITRGMGGSQSLAIPYHPHRHRIPGKHSYIKPEYTNNRSEAASAFIVETTKIEDLHAADLSKEPYFRYLHAFYTYGGSAAIAKVWLSTTTEGDGRTEDINRGRGGRSLYLCWEYEKDLAYLLHSALSPVLQCTLYHSRYAYYLLTSQVIIADHPFYTVDCRDELHGGSEITVRLSDIVFSQDTVVASKTPSIARQWEDDIDHQTIQTILSMTIENRRAYIAARYNHTPLRVVPIRRHTDAPGEAANRVLLSLDNHRLGFMRATLPADESIRVRIATKRERRRELGNRWTSKEGGYSVKVGLGEGEKKRLVR